MIEKHTCKNGLRIILEPISTVRSVTIGIWVLTGSRNETEENNGISHFLEHMLFKGTKKRSAQEIAEAFDSIGGQVNAFTSKEYTCYYAKVLDTYKEYALDILTDMFFHSTFDEAEIEKEKKVVYEEIKMYEDTPDDIVHDLLAKASFGNHPLGYSILGTEDRLQTFTQNSLMNYLRTYYVPENIVVSIAGNVQSDFIKTVEDYFDQFQTSTPFGSIHKPLFIGEQLKKSKDTEQAHLCLGYNGFPLNDKRIASMMIINNVLGGSMSSRLFQEVREEKGLAYSVYSYHSAYLDSGLLTLYAGTAKDQLPELLRTIQDTIKRLSIEGITDKELKSSKEQLKGNILLSLESSNSRMSRNGRNELLLGRHRTLDEIIQEIDSVDHSMIKSVVETVFQGSYSRAVIAP